MKQKTKSKKKGNINQEDFNLFFTISCIALFISLVANNTLPTAMWSIFIIMLMYWKLARKR